jgi:hypothetical protein
MHADIAALEEAFDAAERDARALLEGLDESSGGWRSSAGSWSVAECLDHLATANTVYLRAMEPNAARALANGRLRRRPALPGLMGGWFVRTLEPPVQARTRRKAPALIQPRVAPPLADAARAFFASHQAVRAFLHRYAGLDLAGVRFKNPFIGVIHFSLATGLHVLAAHERRHLWQARRVRDEALRAAAV